MPPASVIEQQIKSLVIMCFCGGLPVIPGCLHMLMK